MIPFLVKLANLLDKRGQYAMAREVDDLVEKLVVISQDNRAANLETLNRLAQQAKMMAQGDTGLDSGEEAAKMVSELSLLQQKSEDDIKSFIVSAFPLLNQLTNRTVAPAQAPDVWEQVSKVLSGQPGATDQDGQPTAEDTTAPTPATPAPDADKASKAKPKQPRKNPQIIQVQKNLGVKETGVWDRATNKAFIAAMNSLPAYAKMMQNGKFKGTLQDAVRYTMQLKDYKDMGGDEKPQAPAQPQKPAAPAKPQYKSHYDLLDIQDSIQKLIAGGYGESIQALIGIAENYADKMRVPPGAEGLNMKQDAFEKYFHQRARMYV